MNAWFSTLKPRERLIVGAGAVLAVAIVGWGFVWKPLVDGSAELRDSVAEKRQLLGDLRRAEQLGPGSAAPSRANASQTLVVLVDSTARSVGLPPFSRTRPDGADGISVSFQETSFDGILNWLIMLDEDYGVAVDSASFNGGRQPGTVTGQLFLSRS
jgi:general secretion pathway protein M